MPVTNYIWDVENDACLSETEENGQTTAAYSYEPVPYGRLISQRRGGATSYYEYDGTWSTRQLTDENQNVIDQYTYAAFGGTVATSGTTKNAFEYTGALGYYIETETMAIYIRARILLPSVGGWLSEDPIWPVDGVSRYVYVSNNPINTADPGGLGPYKPPGSVTARDPAPTVSEWAFCTVCCLCGFERTDLDKALRMLRTGTTATSIALTGECLGYKVPLKVVQDLAIRLGSRIGPRVGGRIAVGATGEWGWSFGLTTLGSVQLTVANPQNHIVPNRLSPSIDM